MRKECILRIAKIRSETRIVLRGNVSVYPGDAIIDLHLWNENLSALLHERSGLGLGIALHSHLRTSFALLAEYVAAQHELADIKAFRARTSLSCRACNLNKYVAIAERYGFAVTIPNLSAHERLHNCFENLLLFALAWAFNPSRKNFDSFSTRRMHLWISREEFLKRYSARGYKSRMQYEHQADCSRR